MRLYDFVKELSKDTPIKVAYKDESIFMRLIGFVLFFNKAFMTKFITTIGNTVYYPSREFVEEYPLDCLLVMAHEFMHIKDSARIGRFKYTLMYLFPQCLAFLSVFSALAFFIPQAWFFLFFLIFLLPIPAPGRKYIEIRGYEMSLYASYLHMKERGFEDKLIKANLSKQVKLSNTYFKNSAYYFMWPFGVTDDLQKFAEKVLNEEVSGGVYDIVKSSFDNSK